MIQYVIRVKGTTMEIKKELEKLAKKYFIQQVIPVNDVFLILCNHEIQSR